MYSLGRPITEVVAEFERPAPRACGCSPPSRSTLTSGHRRDEINWVAPPAALIGPAEEFATGFTCVVTSADLDRHLGKRSVQLADRPIRAVFGPGLDVGGHAAVANLRADLRCWA
ncbi:hypothetical protein DLJ47_06010 [Micromonospora sp. S4605]|uniref:hypothetical protein n=1 Tax=Micromonospora sp. S4605 TaxID=1420897 RepID=UPI000D7010D8|nr:hypothetical protein [Micromonospora sp. S4605]PWU56468.1 hypothetical protein DLJ47_06010 [Micromonospora sp. S4605]